MCACWYFRVCAGVLVGENGAVVLAMPPWRPLHCRRLQYSREAFTNTVKVWRVRSTTEVGIVARGPRGGGHTKALLEREGEGRQRETPPPLPDRAR